jgi:lysophospholipase L1-like esterase
MNSQMLLALGLATLLFISTGHAADDRANERWVGTWAAAPQPFMPGALETFRNQSVRLIVRTSIGGSKIRVRISNLYGDESLMVGAAHAARIKRGADIEPASDRALTFGGKSSVIIAPGRFATSDAVALDVAGASNLAITLFLPNETAAKTSHFLALQTSYVSPAKGDFTSAQSFPVEREIDSWPFLAGIDVVGAPTAATLVVFGDSTVDGDGSTANANHRWPDMLAKRLLERSSEHRPMGVLNEGIIGNRLLTNSPHASQFGDALGEAGLARFERDALGHANVTHVIVRIGVNDIGFPGSFAPDDAPMRADALIAGYRKLIAAAHARGVRIIGTTITPFEGTKVIENYYTADKESVRQQVNAWLRETRELDGLIDLDRVLRDPDHPTRLLPAYDSGDHLHPSDAGYAASADAVDLSLLRQDVAWRRDTLALPATPVAQRSVNGY